MSEIPNELKQRVNSFLKQQKVARDRQVIVNRANKERLARKKAKDIEREQKRKDDNAKKKAEAEEKKRPRNSSPTKSAVTLQQASRAKEEKEGGEKS